MSRCTEPSPAGLGCKVPSRAVPSGAEPGRAVPCRAGPGRAVPSPGEARRAERCRAEPSTGIGGSGSGRAGRGGGRAGGSGVCFWGPKGHGKGRCRARPYWGYWEGMVRGPRCGHRQEAPTGCGGEWGGRLSAPGASPAGLGGHWGSAWLGLVPLGSTLGCPVGRWGREQSVWMELRGAPWGLWDAPCSQRDGDILPPHP